MNRVLVLILVVGVAVRLGLLAWFSGLPIYVEDERSYNAIAVNLARDGEFAETRGMLTSIRPPLYPAFVSTVYRCFGTENFQAVRALQAALGLVLTVLVYSLASRQFSRRTGELAAAGCCFYPALLGFENLVLTETLFAVWIALLCWLVQIWLVRGGKAVLIVLGGVLGLAALTRSVLWLFPPVLFLYLVFASRESGWWRRCWHAAVPGLVFLVVLAPWTIRNTRLHQTLVTVDVMGGRNVMMGNYEYTPLYRAWDAISLQGEEAWWQVLLREEPSFATATQGQKDKLAMRRGLQFMFAHPVLTAQRSLVKFCNFWQLERTLAAGLLRGYWGSLARPTALLIAAVIVGSYAVAIQLAIVGAVMAARTDSRWHWFVLLLVGFICGIHALAFGHSRYHVPLMPVLLVYAAAAVAQAGALWRQRKTRLAVVAVVGCALLAASWGWEVLVIGFRPATAARSDTSAPVAGPSSVAR